MSDSTTAAELLDEDTLLGLTEFCSICGVDKDLVLGLIEEGVIEPVERSRTEPRFTGVAVHRVNVVYRLQRDLGVNRAGAGLALDLLDELRDLRTRLRALEARFPDQL